MRDWIRCAARLYPRSWRDRYGVEFDALLDDAAAGSREFLDVLTGALMMQLRRVDYWNLAAGAALAGVLIAAVISFALPGRYVSTATLRVSDTGLTEQEVRAALSRSSLAEIIQRPSLDLYRGERSRVPMEDVIEQMRTRDIRVRQSGNELRIAYAHPDPEKAQAVTRALLDRFASSEESFGRFRAQAWRDIWPDAPAPSDKIFEVLAPASLPDRPVEPNRLPFLAAGLGAGVIAGLLAAASMHRPKPALRLAAFALIGCVLGGIVSWFLPGTYVSTAVLRFSLPIVPDNPKGAPAPIETGRRMHLMQQQILSRDNLVELMNRPSLSLYQNRLAKEPLEQVVATMRDELTIRPVGANAFQISFTYANRYKAQAVVREVITQFFRQNVQIARAETSGLTEDSPIRRIQEHRFGSNLEVLDPASFPQTSVAPNRTVVTTIGMALGLMLGVLTLRRGRATGIA